MGSTTYSTDLVRSDLREILEAAGSNYVTAYDQIVNRVEETSRTSQIVNRSARVEAFKDAVAKRARGPLAKANKTLSGFMGMVRENADLLHSEEARQMTIAESESVMDEALAIQTIREIVEAEWDAVKDRAFFHMTERFAADGENFPEHINGSIDVPSRGYRFAREGAGRKDPELNEAALKALVGDEVWERITTEEIIPAQVVQKVDIPKLMAEATTNPEVLDHLERSLKVGEWKKPRLNLRKM